MDKKPNMVTKAKSVESVKKRSSKKIRGIAGCLMVLIIVIGFPVMIMAEDYQKNQELGKDILSEKIIPESEMLKDDFGLSWIGKDKNVLEYDLVAEREKCIKWNKVQESLSSCRLCF